MKAVITYAVGVLLCLCLLAALPVNGEEAIYGQVVRLHILANSDSDADQALKLEVRDAILRTHGSALRAGSEEEAEAQIRAAMPAIQRTAEETVAAAGYTYPVRVTFTRETYPTRYYDSLAFPAGTYPSLRILIGEGAGQNWWCVLFPPLCVGAATAAVPDAGDVPPGMTDSTWRLVSEDGEREIRFRVLEWVEEQKERRPA